MVAAKFGVFGNNIETTGIQEKRALCHLPEDPPGGPASQVDQPRPAGSPVSCPKVLGTRALCGRSLGVFDEINGQGSK